MLILLRHGQTAANAARLLLGRADPPDGAGKAPGSGLGRRRGVARARRVVTSPLLRTAETAALLGPPVTVDDRWIEIDYGRYDGTPLAEVPPEVWTSWRADPAWRPEGGESLAAVGARVRAACEELSAEAAVADIVVVSHVSPIKAAVAWALGIGDEAVWRMFLDVASVCRIGLGPEAPTLRSFNEVGGRLS